MACTVHRMRPAPLDTQIPIRVVSDLGNVGNRMGIWKCQRMKPNGL